VILTFKTCYLFKTFDMFVEAVDDEGRTVKEFWKSFSFRDS
jgi:hypothetical protein